MKWKTAGGKCQREGGDVCCLDLGTISLSAQQFSLNSSSLPVLLKSIELYPVRAVISKSPGREANLSGNAIPTVARDSVNSPIDLSLGVDCVVMTGLGADDVGELNSLRPRVLWPSYRQPASVGLVHRYRQPSGN